MYKYATPGVLDFYSLECVPCIWAYRSVSPLYLHNPGSNALILNEYGHLWTILGIIISRMDSQFIVTPTMTGRPVCSAHPVLLKISEGIV